MMRVASSSNSSASRFHVDRSDLITCLENDPEIRIGLGYWATWFIDEPLSRTLAALPDDRFVSMRLHYRRDADGLPAVIA